MPTSSLVPIVFVILTVLMTISNAFAQGLDDDETSTQQSSQGEDNLNNQQYEDNFFNSQDDSLYAGNDLTIMCHFCDFGSDEANDRTLGFVQGEEESLTGSDLNQDYSANKASFNQQQLPSSLSLESPEPLQNEDNFDNQQDEENFSNQQKSAVYSDEDVIIMCHYIGDEQCRPM
ncbi:MAG: hypothetical protein WBX01_12290 [Nitrososphaeraceae archaeon]